MWFRLVRRNINDTASGKEESYVKYDGSDVTLPKYEYAIHGLIIFIGAIAGIISTYETLHGALSSDSSNFVPPCYINFDMSFSNEH